MDAGPFSGLSRQKALVLARDCLVRGGVLEAQEDARLLLLAACKIDRADFLSDPDAWMGAAAAASLAAFLTRRINNEPVTRILGRRAFWTLDLAVRPDVLDPRGDSEAVVRLALRLILQQDRAQKFLDLGCGSGALLCALLDERPNAIGLGVDLSPAACALARDNIAANGLADRAFVVQGFWGAALAGGFDLIVSNPPYISTQEIAALAPEVRNFDPMLALDGGADGLACYRAILATAHALLTPAGALVLEMGAGQRQAIETHAKQLGYRLQGVEDDLGGHARAIAFKL